jgi:hypothetical protein
MMLEDRLAAIVEVHFDNGNAQSASIPSCARISGSLELCKLTHDRLVTFIDRMKTKLLLLALKLNRIAK